jgi:HNH endonuclease
MKLSYDEWKTTDPGAEFLGDKEQDPVWRRFWNKVRKGEDCWEWIGSKDRKGYGRLAISQVPILAHRIAWQLEHGEIPEGLCVLHHCDNPSCVRVAHLYLGDRGDNMRDCLVRSRHWTDPRLGEKHGMSKLQSVDILRIRSLDLPHKVLARMFMISRRHINDIKRRKAWRHI